MPILEVEHLCKTFERTEVLKDISTVFDSGKTNLIDYASALPEFSGAPGQRNHPGQRRSASGRGKSQSGSGFRDPQEAPPFRAGFSVF